MTARLEVRVTRSSQILGGDTPSVPRNSFIGDLSEPAKDPGSGSIQGGWLRPAQRAALRAGERAVSGTGHAEATIINAARAEGAAVEAIAASRPICASCAHLMREVGARFGSILKQ